MKEVDQVIVRTKLTPPVSQKRKLVRRQRLASLLSTTDIPRLIIVTAPAGYGKTSLLYQWFSASRERNDLVGWLSVDPQDNNPARFLRHMIAALSDGNKYFGESTIRYLDAARHPDIRQPVGHLVNELSDVSREVILFLDDYHLIDNPDIDAFLDYFLKLAPPNLHIVISSRLVPDLSLPDLRLRQELLELDAQNLQFDKSETFSFLDIINQRKLSSSEIELLHERSEGWVAGLQLAATALTNNEGLNDLGVSFNGTLRDIADYLARAVLQNQTEDVRDFLLKTSVLERFNADLCAYVTGNPNSQKIIELLEQSHLFVVPLDENRIWYRYHHLFQDFLQAALKRGLPSEVVPLHRLAADWFMEHGLGGEAVDYALHAGDTAQAATMAEQHAQAQILAGYMPETARWLLRLPVSLQRQNPILLSQVTLCLWHIFQQEEASQMLSHFERQLDMARDRLTKSKLAELQNEISLHQGGIAVCGGHDPLNVLKHMEKVDLCLLTPFLKAVYHNIRGIALGEISRFTEALESFRLAARIHRSAGSPLGVACAYYLEALMWLECGNLNRIYDILLQIKKETVFNARAASYINPSMLESIEGILHYERGDVDRARKLLEANLDLTKEVGHLKMVSLARTTYARILASQGNLTGAHEQLEDLADILRRNEPESYRAIILADYERIKLALLHNNPAQAQLIANKFTLQLDGPPPELQNHWDRLSCLKSLAWCRAQLVRGSPERAHNELRRISLFAREVGRTWRYMEARLLEALALDMLGQEYEAADILKPVLKTASMENMVNVIRDEGPRITNLIRRLQERDELIGINPTFLRKVLTEEPSRSGNNSNSAQDENPIEVALRPDDFSDKERTILEQVAIGKSNAMIATRLEVTPHAIKWHLSNIFTKLQVRNRAAAVNAAKAIKLI